MPIVAATVALSAQATMARDALVQALVVACIVSVVQPWKQKEQCSWRYGDKHIRTAPARREVTVKRLR